jgi:hypothetical protein
MEPSSELLGILKRRRSLNGELTQSPAQRYFVNDHLAELLSRSQFELRRGLFATNAYHLDDLLPAEQIEINSPVPFPTLPDLTPAHKIPTQTFLLCDTTIERKKGPIEEPAGESEEGDEDVGEEEEADSEVTVRKRWGSAMEAETEWLAMNAHCHWHCSTVVAVDRDQAAALAIIFTRVGPVMLCCRVHMGSGGQGFDFGAFPGHPLDHLPGRQSEGNSAPAGCPDINISQLALGDTLLHLASKNGKLNCTRKLLELGADIGSYNAAGRTARVQATEECRNVFTSFFREKAKAAAAAAAAATAAASGGSPVTELVSITVPAGWESVPLPTRLTAPFFKGLHVLVNDGAETRMGRVDRMLKAGRAKGTCKVFWEDAAAVDAADTTTGYNIDLCNLRYGTENDSVGEAQAANGGAIQDTDQRSWVGIRKLVELEEVEEKPVVVRDRATSISSALSEARQQKVTLQEADEGNDACDVSSNAIEEGNIDSTYWAAGDQGDDHPTNRQHSTTQRPRKTSNAEQKQKFLQDYGVELRDEDLPSSESGGEYWGEGEGGSGTESESGSILGSPLNLSVSQRFDDGDGENYSAV